MLIVRRWSRAWSPSALISVLAVTNWAPQHRTQLSSPHQTLAYHDDDNRFSIVLTTYSNGSREVRYVFSARSRHNIQRIGYGWKTGRMDGSKVLMLGCDG